MTATAIGRAQKSKAALGHPLGHAALPKPDGQECPSSKHRLSRGGSFLEIAG